MNENYLQMLSELPAAVPKPFLATTVKAAYNASLSQENKQSGMVRWISVAAAAMLIVNLFIWWSSSNFVIDNSLDNEDATVSVDGYDEFNNFYDNDK